MSSFSCKHWQFCCTMFSSICYYINDYSAILGHFPLMQVLVSIVTVELTWSWGLRLTLNPLIVVWEGSSLSSKLLSHQIRLDSAMPIDVGSHLSPSHSFLLISVFLPDYAVRSSRYFCWTLVHAVPEYLSLWLRKLREVYPMFVLCHSRWWKWNACWQKLYLM